MTSIYTQAFLDALDRMIASGVKVTQFEGRRVEYRDMRDLLDARALVARVLADASGVSRVTSVNPEFSRGTD